MLDEFATKLEINDDWIKRDMLQVTNGHGLTPFLLSAYLGQVELFKVLMEHKVLLGSMHTQHIWITCSIFPSKALVVSLSQKFDTHCLELVGSRQGIE